MLASSKLAPAASSTRTSTRQVSLALLPSVSACYFSSLSGFICMTRSPGVGPVVRTRRLTLEIFTTTTPTVMARNMTQPQGSSG